MGCLLPPLEKNTNQNDSTDLLAPSNPSFHEIQPADTSPIPVDHHQSPCHTSLNISPDESTPPLRTGICVRYHYCMLALVRMGIIPVTLIALSPILVVFCLIMRMLQFIRHGHGYYNATQLKLFIRIWICQLIAFISFCSLIALTIFKSDSSSPGHSKWEVATNKVFMTLPPLFYFLLTGISLFSSFLPPILCVIIPHHSPFNHVGLYVRERLLEIIDCVLFWWVESKAIEYFPTLKHHKSLGLHTQQWVTATLSVFIGYNVIALFTCVIMLGLQKLIPNMLLPGINDTAIGQSMGGKYIVYYADGVKHSITAILNALMLLLTWVLYFGSHLNDTPKAKSVFEIGTWTFVSFLICSVFWLIKTSLLLSWEAIAVYNRLGSKLSEGGKQLYFLGLIGRHEHDILDLQYDAARSQSDQDNKQTEAEEDKSTKEDKEKFRKIKYKYVVSKRQGLISTDDSFTGQVIKSSWFVYVAAFQIMLKILDKCMKSKSDKIDEWEKQGASELKDEEEDVVKHFRVKKLSRKMKERVKNDLLMLGDLTSTIHGIQQVAQYLLIARKVLCNDNYTSDILLSLEKGSEDGIVIKENLIKQLIQGECNGNGGIRNSSSSLGKRRVRHEWDHFKDQLGTCSEEIELETIKAWMDKARNNCLFVANTLSSAKEVVDCLNTIISLLLIVATLIMWLLLTGLATTKVFVMIASPLLAATFIFGDSCKSLFQGIMFIYVVHPFDIGDLCVIDENMMEVRTIGIWKTTFLKVGTQAEVILTNSELSAKDIVNHKTDFDWNDSIELEVASLDAKKIKDLKQEIESHLNAGNKRFKPSHNCVMVLTTGSNIKIAISFQHQVNSKTSTYFECVKEKQRRQSELALEVQVLFEKTSKGKIAEYPRQQSHWSGIY